MDTPHPLVSRAECVERTFRIRRRSPPLLESERHNHIGTWHPGRLFGPNARPLPDLRSRCTSTERESVYSERNGYGENLARLADQGKTTLQADSELFCEGRRRCREHGHLLIGASIGVEGVPLVGERRLILHEESQIYLVIMVWTRSIACLPPAGARYRGCERPKTGSLLTCSAIDLVSRPDVSQRRSVSPFDARPSALLGFW